MSSRPPSRNAKKGRASPKQKPKPPKVVIKELTEQNENLTQELEAVKYTSQQLRERLLVVTRKLVANSKRKEHGIYDETDLSELSPDVLTAMLEALIVKRRAYDVSVEARTEELEARVTEMSMELAKMTKRALAYEAGLRDITNCQTLDQVQDRVYDLQLIAGEEYNTFSANDCLNPGPGLRVNALMNGDHEVVPAEPDGITDRQEVSVRSSLATAHKLNLTPPSKRGAGETYVRHMHRDLRLYIMKQLSQEKISGSDWRMFAQRVGVDEDTVNHWRSLQLEYPMGRVLSHWESSPDATVRMLHRHLRSPQLRCTILAKQVSDYYDVD